MLSLQENLDSFLALAAELQLKGLQENQNKDNAETDPIKKIRHKIPNQSKRTWQKTSVQMVTEIGLNQFPKKQGLPFQTRQTILTLEIWMKQSSV